MSQKKNRDKGYLKQTAALAPVFLTKAIAGDAPKGLIESVVEGKTRNRSAKLSSIAKKALLKKPMDRAIGAGLGVATAVPFIRGIQLAQSKNKKDRRKGLAMIGGSTVGYQMLKSGKEGYRIGKPKGVRAGVRSGVALGGLRSAIKLPGAVAMGAALAKSQKDKKKGSKSSLGPIAAGALATGGTRAVEELTLKTPKGSRAKLLRNPRKLLRKVGPSFAGGAAAGAFGGLVLDKVVDKAVDRLKRKDK